MKLYNKNPKDKIKNQLLNLFPSQVMGSGSKDGGYFERGSYTALSEDKFIRYNSPDLISIIAIDIDSHKDGGIWLDYDLPQPTWTVWTDRGVQLAWVLRKPILAKVPQHLKMAREVLARLVYALDGDINAMGFNRVFRNPLNNKSFFSDTRVDLKDFYLKLPKPSKSWWDKVRGGEVSGYRLSSTETAIKGMKEGEGRNNALFNTLRFYAYGQARKGVYNEFDLAEQALLKNRDFADPLGERELNSIIGSIDKFMTTKYNLYRKGDNMSEAEMKERASRAGKQSGRTRKMKSDMKIQATITQMQSFDIKITVSDVARRACVERTRAREYLKEKGWKEVSRKEGWKRKA